MFGNEFVFIISFDFPRFNQSLDPSTLNIYYIYHFLDITYHASIYYQESMFLLYVAWTISILTRL